MCTQFVQVLHRIFCKAVPLTSCWMAETGLSLFAFASLDTLATIFSSPFLTNRRIDERVVSVCYSSPPGWPDTCVSLHANSVAARLLPSLCWWLLLGLHWCVMLADAICCKLASWPESYPTSLAAGLRGTNGCGQLLSKLRWRSEATNVHPCINSGVGAASALSEGSYLRHCTTKGHSVPFQGFART